MAQCGIVAVHDRHEFVPERQLTKNAQAIDPEPLRIAGQFIPVAIGIPPDKRARPPGQDIKDFFLADITTMDEERRSDRFQSRHPRRRGLGMSMRITENAEQHAKKRNVRVARCEAEMRVVNKHQYSQ